MIIYFLLFFFIVTVNILAGKNNSRKVWALALSFLFMAIFIGISDMLGGYDRYIYGELFDNFADITKEGGVYKDAYIFSLYPSEFGFSFYNILVSYFTANRYIFILVTTFLIYTLFYVSIKEYCCNYSFAVILFMGLLFFFSFTYLRQLIGVGFAWLSMRYVYKRSLFKFLICVFLAASFHNSAIILILFYFIPIKRYKEKHVMLFMAFCLILGLSGGPSALFRIYGDVADMHNRSDSYVENEVGFKFEYIIEASVFLYIVLKNYTKIPQTKKDIVMLNALLVFCAILLLFVQSLNGGRMGWYYLIGVIATLSTICNASKINIQTKGYVILICFILYTRIVLQWGFMLSPYKTFFTNGVRSFDPVYEKYEYDENYATDKFYR